MPVILVAYSGGYLPAAFALAQGGAAERVRGVILLDALYGEEDKFVDWIERAHDRAFFVSAYSKSSHEENEALRQRLADAGVETQEGMPGRLGPGVVAFVDAGDADHVGFVNSAWTSDPLRDVLARVRTVAARGAVSSPGASTRRRAAIGLRAPQCARAPRPCRRRAPWRNSRAPSPLRP